ncbi:hypothetical protein DFH07DRAFT_833672 [Mycena maculata]|uniref:Uncharacterized protein n=1 Tax=Mycena maculata TaxID=230809 RepID=A0AAD7N3Z1_9AGAR|nr:hypothetical protein DFH07DRAFT_833672 [Mycena maculata]
MEHPAPYPHANSTPVLVLFGNRTHCSVRFPFRPPSPLLLTPINMFRYAGVAQNFFFEDPFQVFIFIGFFLDNNNPRAYHIFRHYCLPIFSASYLGALRAILLDLPTA